LERQPARTGIFPQATYVGDILAWQKDLGLGSIDVVQDNISIGVNARVTAILACKEKSAPTG